MSSTGSAAPRGFTLIELLIALLVLSLLALMSYRGLGAVLDAREHVSRETVKWRRVAAFLTRFERDVQLAMPRTVRTASGTALPWRGEAVTTPIASPTALSTAPSTASPTASPSAAPATSPSARLEFSRFASVEGVDSARRIGYQLNDKQQIELWVWSGLDVAPGAQPARYPVLTGVRTFELQYLNPALVWVDAWPTSARDPVIPRAVRLRIVLDSSEDIVRVFALSS